MSEEFSSLGALEEEIIAALRQAMATGDVTSPEAKRVVELHAQYMRLQWGDDYTPRMHIGFTNILTCDKKFKAQYDTPAGAGATQFLHDAVKANLS